MAAYDSNTQYTRKLENFRGVDLSSGQTQVAPYRFAYAQNMWKDYSSELGGAVETVPGFRLVKKLAGRIHGIWQFKPTGQELHVMVHAGGALYGFKHSERDTDDEPEKIGDLADTPSTAFVYSGRFYILDGSGYYVAYFEDDEFVFEDVTGQAYLPTTFVNGEMYEQRNMLCDQTINRETQAEEFDPSELYRYSRSGWASYGYNAAITGFRKNVKSDIVVVIGEVTGFSDDSAETYGAVEKIAENAFKGNGDIKRVCVASASIGTVDFVGKSAFEGCTALETADVQCRVGERGFADCTALKEIQLFGAILEKQCFLGCTNLDTVKFTGVSFQKGAINTAFEGCNKIKNLYLGNLKSEFWHSTFELVEEEVEDEYGDTTIETSYEVTWHNYFNAYGEDVHVYTELSEDDWLGVIFTETPDGGTPSANLSEVFRGAVVHYSTATPIPDAYIDRTPDEAGDHNKYMLDSRIRYATVYDPANSVAAVEIGGNEAEEYGIVYHVDDEETYVDKLIFIESATTDEPLTDKEIDITLNCKPSEFTTAEGYINFADGNTEYKGTSRDAIIKCRISTTFDGHVFITGNPDLPNTVFYTARDNTGHTNPAYFGILNYVNDGVGSSENVAFLPTANMLMVLKGRDPHDATIYYHTGVDTENDVIPRVYPSERGLAGEGCLGAAVNFRDDAVFISPRGLEAVDKQQVNLERTLGHRSSLIDRVLALEDLKGAVTAEWEGYLVIFTPSGNTYLADSRQIYSNTNGGTEYEWYLLTDIGTFEGQTEDYIQLTGDVQLFGEDGALHWLTDEDVEAYVVVGGARYKLELPPSDPQYVPYNVVYSSHIYSQPAGSGVWYLTNDGYTERVPVALIDGKAYLFEPSGRFSGGEYKCVTAAENVDEVLYFGTEGGDICCFNTDKRGEGYSEEPGVPGRIHRHWYAFNERQIDSILTTAYDSAGYPDLAKKTVKKSLVAYTKTFPGSRVETRVRTNRNDIWHEAGMINTATYDFYSTDYVSAPMQLADETLTTIREKEKKWALKQLYFGSVGFRSPWGLYHVGYRFTITGRIKT